MPVFESEELGVIVLGCHFSKKAEHVPIKKRKFLFTTPSPPLPIASPCPEETDSVIERQHSSGQGFPGNSTAESEPANVDDSASADLGQPVNSDANVSGKNLVMVNEKSYENDDFSGISVLAAAACSHSLRGNVEDCSRVEEQSGSNGISQQGMKIESNDDTVDSVKISMEGIDSCVSPAAAGECSFPPKIAEPSLIELACENVKDATSLQESAGAGSVSKQDDMKVMTQQNSARDDRLHWDLNTVMDAWEQPFDSQHMESAANVAEGFSEHAEGGKHSNENKNLEGHEFKNRPIGMDEDNMKMLNSYELRGLTIEPQNLNSEEDKLDSCTDNKGAVSIQGKMHTTEIDHTRHAAMDLNESTGSLDKQEKVNPNDKSGSSSSKHGLATSSSGFIDEDASAFYVKSGTSMNTENLSSHCVDPAESTEDHYLPPESGHDIRVSGFEGNCNATPANAVCVETMEDCAAGPQIDRTHFFGSQPMEKNVSFPSVALAEKATCDIENTVIDNDGDAHGLSELLDDANVVKNMSNVEEGQGPIYDVREVATVFKSDVRSSHIRSNSAAPTTISFLGEEPMASTGTMVQHAEKILLPSNVESDSQVHIIAEEQAFASSDKSMAPSEPPCSLSSVDACKSYHGNVSHSYSNVLGEAPENGCDTEVSQGGIVGIGKSNELQMDYDYQYEDGELRESIVHAWEEYDTEEEVEHLDYGLDNRDINNLNVQSHSENSLRGKVGDSEPRRDRAVGSGSPHSRVRNLELVKSHEKGSGSVTDNTSGYDNNANEWNDVKEANQSADVKTKFSGWDCLPRKATTEMAIVKEGISRSDFSGNQKDGSDAETKMFCPKVKVRVSPSHIESSMDCSMFLRGERLGIHGRRSNVDDRNPRPARDFEIAKSIGRGRDSLQRGRGGFHWARSSGGDRGLKRRRSPSYHRLAPFHRSGLEDLSSDGTLVKEGVAGSSRRGTNDFQGLHRSFRRNGSPSDRLESSDTHRDSRAGGEMDLDRFPTVGRGRSSRYIPRVSSGGLRGRYHVSSNDSCIESSLNYSHPATRRRKFSPIERRRGPPAYQSSSRSPSKSRGRSPNAWQSSPRGRHGLGITGNLRFRHRSRSPDFRSGARMQRMRSPPFRTSFLPDHEMGFSPAPRPRDSPPPNSRWIGYKQRPLVLDRRSPGRIGMRGERFDMLDTPRQIKSNEYHSSVRSGRFSDLNGVGRVGPRYDGTNNDRGKHGYRCGLADPVKRFDMEGAVRQHDVNGVYVAGRESRDLESADCHGRLKPSIKDIDSQIGDCTKV